MRSSSKSKRNWKQELPKSEPKKLPFSDYFLGRAKMREPIGCSLGLVTLPIRVRALSQMSVETSKSKTLMHLVGASSEREAKPLPFSAVV